MRILIADDHALFRDSLLTLLEAHDFDVVAAASDGAEALARAKELRPDVILLDLSMPVMGGLEATRALRQELPETAVVILTASEDDRDLFAALKAGAQGYIVKNLEAEKFLSLLGRVASGELVLSPTLARKVLQELRQPRRDPDALTERETEVLRMMTTGVTSNRKLAQELGVSENTVKFHVRNILDKLHLNDRAQAVGHALRHRLVEETS